MLQRLFRPRPSLEAGRRVFRALATQARSPAFYATLRAPDTVEGRFELYVMHLVLVLHRLKGEGAQAAEVAQATFDTFLKNLDEGLRDMGVGDLSVGKKMRKLGEAVYGRIKSYDRALEGDAAEEGLTALVRRTVYQDAPAAGAEALARYVTASVAALAAVPLDAVMAGDLAWGELEHG